jgi:hypothetical protein
VRKRVKEKAKIYLKLFFFWFWIERQSQRREQWRGNAVDGFNVLRHGLIDFGFGLSLPNKKTQICFMKKFETI